jgi:hypothetical protein
MVATRTSHQRWSCNRLAPVRKKEEEEEKEREGERRGEEGFK